MVVILLLNVPNNVGGGACDPNVYLDIPSIGCVFLKLSPHLGV